MNSNCPRQPNWVLYKTANFLFHHCAIFRICAILFVGPGLLLQIQDLLLTVKTNFNTIIIYKDYLPDFAIEVSFFGFRIVPDKHYLSSFFELQNLLIRKCALIKFTRNQSRKEIFLCNNFIQLCPVYGFCFIVVRSEHNISGFIWFKVRFKPFLKFFIIVFVKFLMPYVIENINKFLVILPVNGLQLYGNQTLLLKNLCIKKIRTWIIFHQQIFILLFQHRWQLIHISDKNKLHPAKWLR